jgi:hypothetical protein
VRVSATLASGAPRRLPLALSQRLAAQPDTPLYVGAIVLSTRHPSPAAAAAALAEAGLPTDGVGLERVVRRIPVTVALSEPPVFMVSPAHLEFSVPTTGDAVEDARRALRAGGPGEMLTPTLASTDSHAAVAPPPVAATPPPPTPLAVAVAPVDAVQARSQASSRTSDRDPEGARTAPAPSPTSSSGTSSSTPSSSLGGRGLLAKGLSALGLRPSLTRPSLPLPPTVFDSTTVPSSDESPMLLPPPPHLQRRDRSGSLDSLHTHPDGGDGSGGADVEDRSTSDADHPAGDRSASAASHARGRPPRPGPDVMPRPTPTPPPAGAPGAGPGPDDAAAAGRSVGATAQLAELYTRLQRLRHQRQSLVVRNVAPDNDLELDVRGPHCCGVRPWAR